MHTNEELFLQMYIIGVLLALIGATVVIDHRGGLAANMPANP